MNDQGQPTGITVGSDQENAHWMGAGTGLGTLITALQQLYRRDLIAAYVNAQGSDLHPAVPSQQTHMLVVLQDISLELLRKGQHLMHQRQRSHQIAITFLRRAELARSLDLPPVNYIGGDAAYICLYGEDHFSRTQVVPRANLLPEEELLRAEILAMRALYTQDVPLVDRMQAHLQASFHKVWELLPRLLELKGVALAGDELPVKAVASAYRLDPAPLLRLVDLEIAVSSWDYEELSTLIYTYHYMLTHLVSELVPGEPPAR